MGLVKRGGRRGRVWYFQKRIGGHLWRVSTGESDKRRAEARANQVEHEIRNNVAGRSTMTVADWWHQYEPTYSRWKADPKRDAQIMAHVLPTL